LISSVANGFNCFRERDGGKWNVDVGEADELRLFDTVLDRLLGVISRAADAIAITVGFCVGVRLSFGCRYLYIIQFYSIE